MHLFLHQWLHCICLTIKQFFFSHVCDSTTLSDAYKGFVCEYVCLAAVENWMSDVCEICDFKQSLIWEGL